MEPQTSISRPQETELYAHSLPDSPKCTWQLLHRHLHEVAELCWQLSSFFGAGAWGYLAGLWHDLGKYNPAFQSYLVASSASEPSGARGPEHSGAGAALVHRLVGDLQFRGKPHPLAMIIAGHHAGLSDTDKDSSIGPTPVGRRLPTAKNLLEEIEKFIPSEILEQTRPETPPQIAEAAALGPYYKDKLILRQELWTRFLFSALIDADRLNTERFCDPDKHSRRSVCGPSIADLQQSLDVYINTKVKELAPEQRSSPVNQKRQEVLARCRAKAELPAGFYSLTVPTGGGKTLAAMSFALRHAVKNEKRRVIVVIPYTSIIEQNAAQYKDALGSDNVLEHHSTLDEARRVRDIGEVSATRHELATENWDAPVIVTTTIQFFESLFANRTTKARKIHNIAQSVVVLDEVQTLRPDLLSPILDVLKQLVDCYGCSIVLSTATPPALVKRSALPMGLENVTPIIERPEELARTLERVRYEGFESLDTPREFADIAAEVSMLEQALVVVNLRADARNLAKLLQGMVGPDKPVFHLSALMCPRHRLAVIKTVRRRLERQQLCILVSTQLIEAGVDLDFPYVYRALAGLDSIVQAAGRCNREGKLGPSGGRVVVFRPTTKPPSQLLRAIEQTEALIAAKQTAGGAVDPSDPLTSETYFRMFYHAVPLDGKNVQQSRLGLNFATTAQRFQMIDDIQVNLIAPYGPRPRGRVFRLLDSLRISGPDAKVFRALQHYTVSIYKSDLDQLRQHGCLAEQIRYKVGREERVLENTYFLQDGALDAYDAQYGLLVDYEPGSNPEAYMT